MVAVRKDEEMEMYLFWDMCQGDLETLSLK